MELSFEFKYRITGFANRCIHAIAPFQDVVNVHFMHVFPFGMKEGWHWRDRKSVGEGGQGKDGCFFLCCDNFTLCVGCEYGQEIELY